MNYILQPRFAVVNEDASRFAHYNGGYLRFGDVPKTSCLSDSVEEAEKLIALWKTRQEKKIEQLRKRIEELPNFYPGTGREAVIKYSTDSLSYNIGFIEKQMQIKLCIAKMSVEVVR